MAPPPVSVPLNEPPADVSGTSARRMIGMLPSVPPPVPRCSLSASSPAWPAVTVTWNVPVCPGASVSEDGDTVPADWKFWPK